MTLTVDTRPDGAITFSPAVDAKRQAVRAACLELLPARAAQMDLDHQPALDIIEEFRSRGLTANCYLLPEAHGGDGLGLVAHCAVIEEIAKVCGAFANTVCSTAIGPSVFAREAPEPLRERYLPRFAEGALSCWAGTEPVGGTDVANWKVRAERAQGGWRLQGSKWFVGHASIAQILIVTARAEEGFVSLVVEAGADGLRTGPRGNTTGFRGFDRSAIFFDDVFVPEENALAVGKEAFKMVFRFADWYRPAVAAISLGLAEGALAYATRYARKRQVFGRPVLAHQLPGFLLADVATEIEAARGMVYAAADHIDQHGLGTRPGEATRLGICARLAATTMAPSAIARCQQVMGGHGYLRDHPLDRAYRDAAMFHAGFGTNHTEILRLAEQTGCERSF